MSNILFGSTGDKNNEQNNTTEESNSNEVKETVTQSPLVKQSDNEDAQRKIFVSLILLKGRNYSRKNICGIYCREFNPECYCNTI